MSRTYRSRLLAKDYWRFRSQSISWAALGQQQLFDDNYYRVRSRHSSQRYPHYTDSFDDVYPSALSDKYGYR